MMTKMIKKWIKFLVLGPQNGSKLDENTWVKHQYFSGHQSLITSLDFSSDNQLLASGSMDHSIRIWDLDFGLIKFSLEEHLDAISSVSFSPDNSLIASASYDRTIKLWDIKTGDCLHTLKGHDDKIWHISFSKDGQQLASSSADGTTRVWDVKTGQFLKTIATTIGAEHTELYSDNMELKALASEENTITIYKLQAKTAQLA